MKYKVIKGEHYESIEKPSMKAFLETFVGKSHDSLDTLVKNLSPNFIVRSEDKKLIEEGCFEKIPVYYKPTDYIVVYITKEREDSLF